MSWLSVALSIALSVCFVLSALSASCAEEAVPSQEILNRIAADEPVYLCV